MRIQSASGRTQLCSLTTSPIAGSLSAANTYYFWIQGRNDIGYNLMSPVTSITVDDSGTNGIRLTLPLDCYRNGENWLRFAISLNTVDDPGSSRVLFECEAVDGDQLPLPLPRNIDITTDDQIDFGTRLVTELPTTDLIEGMLRTIDGVNKRYIGGGNWEDYELTDFTSYVIDPASDDIGCDLSIEDLDETNPVIRYTYPLDGSAGKRRRYWVFNDLNTDISEGSRASLNITLNGRDVSGSYEGLLYIGFEGIFKRSVGELDKLKADGLTPLPFVDTEEPYGSSMDLLILPESIGNDEAWQIYVYPQFTSELLYGSSTIPSYNSEIQIWPYILTESGIPTGLGTLLGDYIFNNPESRRRVYPADGLSCFVDSGSGIVNGYKFEKVPQTSIDALEPNTADQEIVINSSGECFLGTSAADNVKLRAIVSTDQVSSNYIEVAEIYVAGADELPTISFDITYPTSIRSNYPDVIAGTDAEFNYGEMQVQLVRRDSLGALQEIWTTEVSLPKLSSTESFTILGGDWINQFSTESHVTNLRDFENNSLWEVPVPANVNIDSGIGITDYEFSLFIQFKSSGYEVSNISHSITDGCIPEANVTLSELLNVGSFWMTPIGTVADLTNIHKDKLIHNAFIYVAEKERLYRYDLNSSEPADNHSFIDVVNGGGQFIAFSGGGGGGITLAEAAPTTTPEDEGQVIFSTQENFAYVSTGINSPADWIDFTFNPDRIITVNNQVAVEDGNIMWE